MLDGQVQFGYAVATEVGLTFIMGVNAALCVDRIVPFVLVAVRDFIRYGHGWMNGEVQIDNAVTTAQRMTVVSVCA